MYLKIFLTLFLCLGLVPTQALASTNYFAYNASSQKEMAIIKNDAYLAANACVFATDSAAHEGTYIALMTLLDPSRFGCSNSVAYLTHEYELILEYKGYLWAAIPNVCTLKNSPVSISVAAKKLCERNPSLVEEYPVHF